MTPRLPNGTSRSPSVGFHVIEFALINSLFNLDAVVTNFSSKTAGIVIAAVTTKQTKLTIAISLLFLRIA